MEHTVVNVVNIWYSGKYIYGMEKKDTSDEKASAQTFPQTESGPAHGDRDGV